MIYEQEKLTFGRNPTSFVRRVVQNSFLSYRNYDVETIENVIVSCDNVEKINK